MLLDFTWAVKLNRFGLELVGLWPKNGEVSKNKFASDLRVIIIFVIVGFVSGIPLTCSLIRVWGDMILMIDNLQVTLPFLVVLLKLVIMRWKQTGIFRIIYENSTRKFIFIIQYIKLNVFKGTCFIFKTWNDTG